MLPTQRQPTGANLGPSSVTPPMPPHMTPREIPAARLAKATRFRAVSTLAGLPGFRRLMAAQLRRPSGLIGRHMVQWMNQVNLRMNLRSVRSAHIAPNDRVIEIGFGGGDALGLMAQRAYRGYVVGVELSKDALLHTAQRYAQLVDEGRLRLIGGDLRRLPFTGACFDVAVSVNTIYFVRDHAAWLGQVYRLLRPGGRFVVSFRPPWDMRRLRFTRYGFDLPDPQTISQLCAEAGFDRITLSRAHDGHLAYICGLACKPAIDQATRPRQIHRRSSGPV